MLTMWREVVGGRLRWVAEVRGRRVESRSREGCRLAIRWAEAWWAWFDTLPEGCQVMMRAAWELQAAVGRLTVTLANALEPTMQRLREQLAQCESGLRECGAMPTVMIDDTTMVTDWEVTMNKGTVD